VSNNALSFSDIATYRGCPKKFYFRSILDLQRKAKSSALYLGSEIHEMLKIYFLGLQSGQTQEEAIWAVDLYRENLGDWETYPELFEDESIEQGQLADEAYSIVIRYLEQAEFADWEILHVEEQFYITLDTGTVISFTPDLVVRDPSGTVWVVDHKSTSNLPTEGIPFGDLQAMLYLAGVSSLYPETKGFIFNRLRKKVPTTPRLNKTKDKATGFYFINNLNNIDTTYELLMDFITAEAPELLTDQRHVLRLAELRESSGRFFWTETVYKTGDAIDTIIDEASNSVDQAGRDTIYSRNLQEDGGWNSCSRCPFARLCQADLLGWDTDQIILEDYEQRDPKNEYDGEVA
jgi:hypothetical protein